MTHHSARPRTSATRHAVGLVEVDVEVLVVGLVVCRSTSEITLSRATSRATTDDAAEERAVSAEKTIVIHAAGGHRAGTAISVGLLRVGGWP